MPTFKPLFDIDETQEPGIQVYPNSVWKTVTINLQGVALTGMAFVELNQKLYSNRKLKYFQKFITFQHCIMFK